MDAKDKVDDGEQISVSLSFNEACSVFVCLEKGIATIRRDYHDANAVKVELRKNPGENRDQLKTLEEQILIMNLCLENSIKFRKEIGELIKELDAKPKTKIILLSKPNF